MRGSYDDTYGQSSSSGRVNMQKQLDLDADYGTDYPCLTGHIRCYVGWAVEKGGIIRKKVDLNAFMSAANGSHLFVATAHNEFPKAADDQLEYGGDTVARSTRGNEGPVKAEEFVDANLARLCGRRDMTDLVFGVTCLGKPMVMANLGELQVRITQPTFQMDGDTIARDNKGKRIVTGEVTLTETELRPIEDPATAALFYRFRLTPNGAYLRRITDSTDFVAGRRVDGKQVWRDLLGGLRNAVERPMVVPAA